MHLFKGYDKIAEMLIKNGANVDSINDKKNSVLMIAAWNGNV